MEAGSGPDINVIRVESGSVANDSGAFGSLAVEKHTTNPQILGDLSGLEFENASLAEGSVEGLFVARMGKAVGCLAGDGAER